MSVGIAVIMDRAAVNVAVDVVAAAAVAAIAAVAGRAAALRTRTEYNFIPRVTLSRRNCAAKVSLCGRGSGPSVAIVKRCETSSVTPPPTYLVELLGVGRRKDSSENRNVRTLAAITGKSSFHKWCMDQS